MAFWAQCPAQNTSSLGTPGDRAKCTEQEEGKADPETVMSGAWAAGCMGTAVMDTAKLTGYEAGDPQSQLGPCIKAGMSRVVHADGFLVFCE